MEVDKTTSRFGVTLALRGELDHHAALAARSMIRDTVEQDLPGKLVLDLSGLSFMDSSGIALLLRTHRRLTQLGGTLRVIKIPTQPRKVLDAAGVGRLISLE
jgi:stage II sporulation protein AA (anti-sigma F factor antagonist)